MSYISFYRKWRPQTFLDIIGQDHVVQTLENAISKNRISHAYIFCGPRGTGKTSLARILAKALNCTNGPTIKPCNKCDNCTSISAGSNVDVIEIDAASNRGINEIRELREKVKYLPTMLSRKVYIIDEVHMLTTEAFNALLKVLEEPPEHVIFILATTEPHQVLQTIMSRCQRFDFFPIPMDKIKKRLKDLSSVENIIISDSAINLIAKYADGSLRDADGILEQLSSLGEDDVKVEDITSLLGVIDIEMMFELANILIEKNLNQALLFVHRVISSNLNLKIFVSEFIDHLYSLYVIKKYDNPFDILNISEDFKERYLSQSKLFSGEELEPLIDLFSDLLKQIKWGENTKTFFKLVILKAVNYNFIDETRLDLKFNNINREINLIKSRLNGIGKQTPQYSEKENSGRKKDTAKNEIEITEIDKNSSPGENQISHSRTDKDADDKEEDINMEKVTSDKEKTVRDNWNIITARLKEKNISIQAMFSETKNFKIIDSTIYFYLEENKKWHKEQLNKAGNVEILQDIIKEITGEKYQLNFDFLLKNNNIKPETINEKNDKKDLTDEKEDSGDIFDYIEKKFEIKEEQKER